MTQLFHNVTVDHYLATFSVPFELDRQSVGERLQNVSQAMKVWTKAGSEYETCMCKYSEMVFCLYDSYLVDKNHTAEIIMHNLLILVHSTVLCAMRKYWFLCIASKINL